jgi:hypothetical protein
VKKIIKRTLSNVLKHDHDVLSLRHDSHKKHDVRVTQNALHDDLVLDFLKKLFRHSGIENFLDSNGSSMQKASMDRREATLTDLFTYLELAKIYLSDTRHRWKSSRRSAQRLLRRESLELLFLELLLQKLDFLGESDFLFPLHLKLFSVSSILVTSASSSRALKT